MSTEPPRKPLSIAPKVPEELDSEWGSKSAEPVQTATEAAVDKVPPAKALGPEGADAKLNKELEGQAEAPASPGTSPPPTVLSGEDEDEDEDDGEEDDEDEDERAVARARVSHGPVVRASPAGHDDWIPDWGPWAVLGLLVVGGLVGGLTLGQPANASDEEKPSVAAAAEGTGKPTSVAASHFLVQYKGAMRAPDSITRTKDEAKARALEGLAKVKKGEDFGKVVGEYSDEPGAAARSGALGEFTADQMVKPFSDAAFALKVGQVSGLVETNFGYHVIKRTK